MKKDCQKSRLRGKKTIYLPISSEEEYQSIKRQLARRLRRFWQWSTHQILPGKVRSKIEKAKASSLSFQLAYNHQYKKFLRWILPIILLLVCALASVAQDAPVVLKVEPPNWWMQSSIDPVRLLIRGKNFSGATVEAIGAGLQTRDVKTSANGNYLFVDVEIDANARAGDRELKITTPNGSTNFKFEISERLPREGRFQGFTPSDVIYLIMPDRFNDGDRSNNDPPESPGIYSRKNQSAYHGGDLQGAIDRLPYLKDLGVTAIWMTPVYDNTNRAKDYEYGKNVTGYHGYHAVDFYKVEEHLGTLEKFKELVDRAHALGMKIIQDQVANHTGPAHIWVTDMPIPTWYNGTVANHRNNVFDIKAVTEENPDRARFEVTIRGWFANDLPDLNQDDVECSRYLIQNAVWWVASTGLDGIRQDTFPYVERNFWSAWNAALKTEFPNLTVVGEVSDGSPKVISFFQGGRAQFDVLDTNLHTVFDFPSYYAMRDVFIRNQPMSRLSAVLSQDALYPNARVLVPFLGNHDVKRFMSEEGASVEKLKNAFTYLLTMRGTPQIYYGDEIAMKGGDDPDNRRDFPGGFLGDKRNAFTGEGRRVQEQKLFEQIRNLLQLRATSEALRSGQTKILSVTDNTLVLMRQAGQEGAIVAFNNSDKAMEVEVTLPESISQVTSWIERVSDERRWQGRAIKGKLRIPLKPQHSMVLIGNLTDNKMLYKPSSESI